MVGKVSVSWPFSILQIFLLEQTREEIVRSFLVNCEREETALPFPLLLGHFPQQLMFRCPVLLFLFLTVYLWCQYWHVWSWPKYLTSQKHDTHKLALFTYLSILPIEEKANVCCTASDSVQRLHSAASSFQFISHVVIFCELLKNYCLLLSAAQ